MCLMHALLRDCRTGIPPQLEPVARAEGMDPARLTEALLRGMVCLPANPRHPCKAVPIGEGCLVKVNVNIGTSAPRCDHEQEMEKARAAIVNGADTLMDLSTAGDIPVLRKKILSLGVPVGTVPLYEAVRKAGSAVDVDPDLLFRVIREHCRDGVDFMTLHCGVNREAFDALIADPRLMGVVSRGGAFHLARMDQTGEENPLFSEFAYLLEILDEYDVVISLGDGMRPGSIHDAGRLAKTTEYLTLGKLSHICQEKGIQRLIEGPGHIPLSQVGYNVRIIKELTDHAPLYLLGPVVTDIAPGYDHVVAAIGSTIACMHGADFLCMVSPSEHLALPQLEDIVEGTRITRIAAHIGDGARKGVSWQEEKELPLVLARKDLDWEGQFRQALFGEHARSIHERDGATDTCSMCGDLCALKLVKDIFKRKRDEPEKKQQ
ncbi:MAG: phosphomethylpyrimidine synthase ThiC [Methanomicrobiales archaeon]|nr:phosphomethylpyrimidine synthase ThiC [Methanomicrobiales archaeon]